jgi:putative transposase
LTASRNGKQEAFWGTLEGRLMKMLDRVADLTLEQLNEVTQAWMEIEYNRAVHREMSCSPVERFAQAPDVLRASPSSEALRDAFRLQTRRSQRQSDGTISLEGVRFEIPARYRHFRDLTVRYARWDLGRVDLVDDQNGTILAPIYPLDKTANADGRRALVQPEGKNATPDDGPLRDDELPPLLKSILQEYSATGMPPAYLPKTSPPATPSRPSGTTNPENGDPS